MPLRLQNAETIANNPRIVWNLDLVQTPGPQRYPDSSVTYERMRYVNGHLVAATRLHNRDCV